MRVLVVNAGSSSIKLRVVAAGNEVEAGRDLPHAGGDLSDQLRDFLEDAGSIDVAGHRVVHGGDRFETAAIVDTRVRQILEELNELAPLHNPPAVAAIDAVARLLPRVPSVACFDTTFHTTLRPEASAYALPAEWVQRWGLRRFGFHGLSCAWAVRRAAELLDRPAGQSRLVICHLGSGASVTSVAAGRSIDTTMGFTPLEGLVMATRPGDVDAGALLWALKQGLAPADVDEALEHRSGLLGLSGSRTSDLRQLIADSAAGDEQALLAVSVYLHRLRAKIAAMAAATDGTDVLVFTGGVGENSAFIRAETCRRMGWLGITVDEDTNARVSGADMEISAPAAGVRTLVIHAREELEIARQCRRLFGASGDDPGR